jgi:dienelactone hydrolase
MVKWVLWDFVWRLDCQYDGESSYYQQQCLTMAAHCSEAEQITTPLLLHYAGLDSRVNEGWPAYELYLERTI